MTAFIHYPRRAYSMLASATLQQKDKSLHQKPIFSLEQMAGIPKVFIKNVDSRAGEIP